MNERKKRKERKLKSLFAQPLPKGLSENLKRFAYSQRILKGKDWSLGINAAYESGIQQARNEILGGMK